VDIKLKELNTFARELVINLVWSEIEHDFEEAIKTFSKKIKLPGFRPGKVPRKVLMGQFKPSIEADFIDKSVNKYYSKALEEEKIIPVNMGSISDVHFLHGENFKFKVSFEVEPKINLPKLKKNTLKVEKTKYVTDEQDIDMAIDEVRNGHAEVKTIEDGAKIEDFIICDLQELDDTGLPIIGKKLETRYIKIGQIPFDGPNQKNLEGAKPQDKVRVSVPTDEKGTLGIYELLVKNVERQVLPELNEDFIKKVDSKAKNISEYRNNVQKQLEKAYNQRSNEAFDQQLTDALIDKINPEFPPSMAESYLNHMVDDVTKNNQQGQLDKDKVKEAYKPVAERNLKWYLIRNELIKEQSFDLSKDALLNEIQRRKDESPNQIKEIDKFFKKPSNRSKLEDDLVEKNILAYLTSFAKIKEVKVKTKDLRKQSKNKP
jgi:trigger factor